MLPNTHTSSHSPPAAMGQQQKHSILRYLTVTKAASSSQAAASSAEQEPSSRPFKQPRLQTQTSQQQQQVQQHKALSSSNHCQQLLAQQLGWRAPPSLNTWHAAQQQQLSCVCLRASAPTQTGHFRTGHALSPVSCLELQQLNNPSALVAVGESHGRLHVCKLSRLQAASASALNAAAALPADVREALMDPDRWARQAMAADGVPPGAGSIPTAAVKDAGVLTLDVQQQLRSCCWLQQQHNGSTAASSSEGVLVTSAPGGIDKRVIAEGRSTVSSSLRAKGGSMVEAAGKVVALDAQAAYQLCAMSGKTLLLWDLRAGPAAAAALPLQAPQTVLQAMPGGQVLLSAAANGQVCLYDVRRLANSSIVNFGSSRANQQLLLTHNLRARAQAAGFSSGGCSVLYGVARDNVHFMSNAVLNPLDPNLLAYVTPTLQAGLFDLVSGQLLQQVPLLAQQDTGSGAAHPLPASTYTSLGGWCSWDSSGRVLYATGMLAASIRIAGSGVAWGTVPSLAAVDFGSWHGRQQRWLGSSQAAAGGEGGVVEQQAEAGGAGADSQQGDSSSAEQLPLAAPGRSHWAQGGQVLHRELHLAASPTAMVAAGRCEEMLVGTHSGDVLWLG